MKKYDESHREQRLAYFKQYSKQRYQNKKQMLLNVNNNNANQEVI